MMSVKNVKKVKVIDSVIGLWQTALGRFQAGRLHDGMILKEEKKV